MFQALFLNWVYIVSFDQRFNFALASSLQIKITATRTQMLLDNVDKIFCKLQIKLTETSNNHYPLS